MHCNRKEAVVNADGGLRMRAEPSTSAEMVQLIPDGARVEILETQTKTIIVANKPGQWTRVAHDSKEGWVFGAFLLHDKVMQDAKLSCMESKGMMVNYICLPEPFVPLFKGKQAIGWCSMSHASFRTDGTCTTSGIYIGKISGTWTYENETLVCSLPRKHNSKWSIKNVNGTLINGSEVGGEPTFKPRNFGCP